MKETVFEEALCVSLFFDYKEDVFLYERKVVVLLLNEFFKKISCRAKIKIDVRCPLFVKSTTVIFIKTKFYSQHVQVKQTDLLPFKCFLLYF